MQNRADERKMIMEQWWNDSERVKPKYWEGKTVLVTSVQNKGNGEKSRDRIVPSWK